MAKPIIYFNGMKFKAGTTVGYRPQLVKCTNPVKDAALAEEICIEAGLSMSPVELLHAIQMTLEHAPRLVATDGRVREFTNLLCWNRSSSGRLDGQYGSWNDSCSAKVLVQLKKNSKKFIDATFRNESEMPVPKLDNVTYVGAVGVTNVLKVGKAFSAYGRNMQMVSGSGDVADIIVNGETHPLTCTESDAAHAKFNWPSELSSLEEGTQVVFAMTSHGGIAGAGMTTNTKKLIVLAADAPQPIAQSTDKSVKVFSITGSEGGTHDTVMRWDETWTFNGEGFNYPTAPAGKRWAITGQLLLYVNSRPVEMNLDTHDATHARYVGSPAMAPEAGLYENVVAEFTLNDDQGEQELLRITIPLLDVRA